MLVGDQVEAERSNPRPVLHRRDGCRWEGGGCLMPAVAAPRPGAMLDCREPDLGQIEYLPRPIADSDRALKTPAAAATDGRHVIDDLVGRCNLGQMATAVTGLAARLAP
jgi:hypothetical protein